MHVTNTPRKLLRWFKRENVWARELNQYLIANPQTNRRVGSLPYEWIKDIEPSKRAQVTQEICDIFQRFAIETKDLCEDDLYTRKMTVEKIVNLGPLYKQLQKALKKILKRNDVIVGYSGHGAVKMCSKIDIGGKSYAFSTFKDKGCRKGFKSYYTKGHGRGYEPQNIFTCYYRGSHGRFARPFLSVISGENDLGSFTLSKYIDYSHPKKIQKHKLTMAREFIFDADSHNKIHGIGFEAGGRGYNEDYIKDRHDREIWYRFTNIITGYYNNLYCSYGVSGVNTQKFLLKEIENGENIYSKNFQTNLKKKLTKSFIENEKNETYYTLIQKGVLHLLSIVGSDSAVSKYLMNHIGTHIKPVPILNRYQNFSEQIEDMIRRSTRKAFKQLRALKKVQLLKSELEQKGQWESIKGYLREDFIRIKAINDNDYYPHLLEKELDLDIHH